MRTLKLKEKVVTSLVDLNPTTMFLTFLEIKRKMKKSWGKSTAGDNTMMDEISTANPDKVGYINSASFH